MEFENFLTILCISIKLVYNIASIIGIPRDFPCYNFIFFLFHFFYFVVCSKYCQSFTSYFKNPFDPTSKRKKVNTGVMKEHSHISCNKKISLYFFCTQHILYIMSSQLESWTVLLESPELKSRWPILNWLSCTWAVSYPPGVQSPLCKGQHIITGLRSWWPECVPPPPLLIVISLCHPMGNDTLAHSPDKALLILHTDGCLCCKGTQQPVFALLFANNSPVGHCFYKICHSSFIYKYIV